MTTKVIDHERAERLERLSNADVKDAVRSLASAAVYAERSRDFTDAPLGAEGNLWLLVRLLTAEYGLDYPEIVREAREIHAL